MAQSDKDGQKSINTILFVMAQVGVATLIVVILSVLGGLWLDNTFGTKPLFTLILLFVGIPVCIVLMYRIARRTIARMTKPESENKSIES